MIIIKNLIMLKESFFGTDGIRGSVTNGEITPEFVLKLGITIGLVLKNYFSDPNVVLGKDNRSSGDMLECAIISGLVKTGVDVVCAGNISTPAIAFLTKSLRFSLGIVISASHNSFHDNGFKFFDSNGNKLSNYFENEIEISLANKSLFVNLEVVDPNFFICAHFLTFLIANLPMIE